MKIISLRAFMLISIGMYLVSLNSIVFSCPTKGFIGYQVLLYGWLGFIYLDPRWVANLCYLWMFLGLLNIPRIVVARWIPYITLVLAAASIPFPSAGCESSGGAAVFSNHLALGGYLWISAVSIVSLVFIWVNSDSFE